MRPEVFRMERVTYQEKGIECLINCDLHIFSGEILGLIPLNSHGLPELLDVMTKNLPLKFGFVFLREKMINNWRNPYPRHNPIGLIRSKSQLVEGLTLTDNVFVLRSGFRARYIQSGLLRAQLAPFFEKAGLDVPVDTYPENLTPFQRVIVELIRAIVAGYRLIVLQDLSAILNERELEKIHAILRQWVQEGISFLYISSQPNDLSNIADRIAVFGNGRVLKTVEKGDSLQQILEVAVGAQWSTENALPFDINTHAVFRAEELSLWGDEKISFHVCPGECVVLQDVYNRAINPLIQLLLGERVPKSGRILLCDRPFSPRENRRIAIIQELPTQSMIFSRLSYFDNLFMTSDHHLSGLWWNKRMQRRLAKEYGKRNGMELFDRAVDSLSELEKYDLVYNRIMFQRPDVVFCIHPLNGADLELRKHIHQLLLQLRKKQIAVVILTANTAVDSGIADRIIRV